MLMKNLLFCFCIKRYIFSTFLLVLIENKFFKEIEKHFSNHKKISKNKRRFKIKKKIGNFLYIIQLIYEPSVLLYMLAFNKF